MRAPLLTDTIKETLCIISFIRDAVPPTAISVVYLTAVCCRQRCGSGIVIGVGSKLLAGGCEARIPVDAIDFFLVQDALTGSWAHPASYSVGTRAQVPRIRISGALPLFPPLCLHDEERGNFTFCHSHYFLSGFLKPSGHTMYRTVVTICTAQWSLYVPQWSLYVPHSGHYMYRTVVTICTAQRSLYVPPV